MINKYFVASVYIFISKFVNTIKTAVSRYDAIEIWNCFI